MGFRLAVVLCLSFAVVARSQLSTITNDLSSKENQLNCLLGKPNCVSPPPPPTTSGPPPATPPATPPAAPPTTPPATPPTTPPTVAPVPAPLPGVPAPAPAPGTPGGAPLPSAPVPAPALVPAPAPGPSAAGTAVAVISLVLPAGTTLTAQQTADLTALIQADLGSDATVTLEVAGGRKLLQTTTTFTLVITQVKDCVNIGLRLQAYINGGSFASDARGKGITVLSASLMTFACSYPGQAPYSITGSPATAPGFGPASGPGAPGFGPSSGTPGSSPIHVPSPAPVPAPM